MESALSEGAKFPSDAPEATVFKFKSFCSGSSRALAEACVGDSGSNETPVSLINNFPDYQKAYNFSSFTAYLSNYFSGSSIQFSVKSLLNKTSVSTTGSYLYVNSKSGLSGVEYIEVTASNSVNTVIDTFMVNINSMGMPVLVNNLSDFSGKANFGKNQRTLNYYFNGSDLVYTAKSLMGKVNLLVNGQSLEMNSKNEAGIDFVEVTATNGSGSVSDTFQVTLTMPDLPVLSQSIEDIVLPDGKTDSIFNLNDYFTSSSTMNFSVIKISGEGILPLIVGNDMYVLKELGDSATTVFEVQATNSDGTTKFRFMVGRGELSKVLSNGSIHSLVGQAVEIYSLSGSLAWSGIWTETPMLRSGNYVARSRGRMFKVIID
jgi:hypothetical protein